MVGAVSYLGADEVDIGETLPRDEFEYSVKDDDRILDLAKDYRESFEDEIRELGQKMFENYVYDANNIQDFYLGFDDNAERVQMFGEDSLMVDYVFDQEAVYRKAVETAAWID